MRPLVPPVLVPVLCLMATLTLAACKDSTGPSHACTEAMSSVRRELGTPSEVTTSGDNGIRTEVWDFHDGPNTLRYTFRWGLLIEGCDFEGVVIT